jgi:hypothetical protein
MAKQGGAEHCMAGQGWSGGAGQCTAGHSRSWRTWHVSGIIAEIKMCVNIYDAVISTDSLEF